MHSLVVEHVESEVFVPQGKRQHYKIQALSRVGETRLNNLGTLMIVDAYNNSQDIWVRFPQGNMVNCTWQQFISGKVKNVYDRSVFGIGFIGEGKYKPSINGDFTIQYLTWAAMINRCYSKKLHEKIPTYKDCTVCDEWHNFQNFAKWYDENYYEIEGHRTHLDKDILIKTNKLYSPETCIFTPQFINALFLKRDAKRGNLPVGVRKSSRKANRYETLMNNNKGERIFLGTYNSPEEAFSVYKQHKEELIKSIAEENKDRIPQKLYNAMLSYTVDIND